MNNDPTLAPEYGIRNNMRSRIRPTPWTMGDQGSGGQDSLVGLTGPTVSPDPNWCLLPRLGSFDHLDGLDYTGNEIL